MDFGGMSGGDSAGQSHDALFRHVLGQPEHAGSEIRAILPRGLVEQLDLDGLELVPGSGA